MTALQASRAGGGFLFRDSECIGYEYEVKHIDDPIAIRVRLRLVRPESLGHCLNRGFSRIKGIRGLNSTNLQRLRCIRRQLPNYACAMASGFSNCRGLKDCALLIRVICVIRDSELVRHKHQIKHIHHPIPVHINASLIRPEPLSHQRQVQDIYYTIAIHIRWVFTGYWRLVTDHCL